MKLTCAVAWLTAILSVGHTVVAQDKPKNLIMVIPDGCDESVLSFARWFKNEPLFLDTLDQGRMLSYMSNSIVADSAPAGTALATGQFSTNRFISVGPDEESMITSMVTDPDHEPWPAFHPIPTIVEAARRKGMATGLVATSTVTHATPGSFGSHVDNRSLEPQMAMQMVHQNIDVIMGGGRANLLPQEECFPIFDRLQGRTIRDCRVDGPCNICEGSCRSDDDCAEGLICHFKERSEPGSIESLVPGCSGESTSATNWCVDPTARVPTSPFGRRDDCLNMEDVLSQRGYDLCYTKTEMDALSGDNPVWCSFAERAMEAEINRATFHADEPSLAEMTKKTIELLSQSEKGAENGFFLMVEASQVDWAGHANDVSKVMIW
jgi:alkaline phosphatase